MSRQQQEKLQFTSRLITLGELASSLAHEINQPLAAISNYNMGSVTRLKAGKVSPEELLPVITALNEQLERLEQTIDTQQRFVADAAHRQVVHADRGQPRQRPRGSALEAGKQQIVHGLEIVVDELLLEARFLGNALHVQDIEPVRHDQARGTFEDLRTSFFWSESRAGPGLTRRGHGRISIAGRRAHRY